MFASKGWDSAHTALLSPLGDSTLVLNREESAAPGWYTVTAVFP